MVILRLTIAENIVLGRREPATAFREENTGDGLLSRVWSNRFVRQLASRFTLGLDVPEREIAEL